MNENQPVEITGEALVNNEGTASASPQPATLQDRGGYTIEYKEFEKNSSAEGFGYNLIQYTSLEKAKEVLGDEALLAGLNRTLATSLSTKAKAKLPDYPEEFQKSNDDIKKMSEDERKTFLTNRAAKLKELTDKFRVETSGVLLSEDEAIKFVPGKRETNSLATIFKEATLARKDGNISLAAELTARAIAMMQEQLATMSASVAAE